MATNTFHYPVTWLSWLVAGSVPGVCSLLTVPYVIYRLHPPEIQRTPEARAFATSELKAQGPVSRQEWITLLVFVSVCLLWITAKWNKIDITVTALLGASALLASNVIDWEDVKNEHAAWDIFIWYGGLLRMGKALGEVGVTGEFAKAVASSFGGAGWITLFTAAIIIYFYTHYGFASITAHLLAMYTPFMAVLLAKGAPLGLMVYAFAIFANLAAGLTHYGTTPSPMYYATDYASFKTFWGTGFVISLVNLAIFTTVGFAWWRLLGIW
jgi:DASS family divalent anion:Na+ symporter